MSLAKVYDAFIDAGASRSAAAEAIEAIETSLDEPWKRSMEARLMRMEIQNKMGFGIIVALLVPIFIKIFWG